MGGGTSTIRLDKMDSVDGVMLIKMFNILHHLILCCLSSGCFNCRLPPLFS